jgi:hypothetical protein
MADLAMAIEDQLNGKDGGMVIDVLLSVLALSIARSPEPDYIRDQVVAGIYRLTEAYQQRQREAAPWAN